MRVPIIGRVTTIVVLSLTAAMTLLGAVGTTCVAFAAENFGPAMAAMVPVKPILQLLVVVSLVAGVVGVAGVVRLWRRAPNAFWWAFSFLLTGLVASGIQFWFSLTLRGSTAPNNVRLYLTAFALVWLLVLRLPGVWRRSGFDRTQPLPVGSGKAAGAAMTASGLLTLTTPWWAAPTHVIDGVNTAEVLLLPLLVIGGALIALGVAVGLGSRYGGRRRLPSPVPAS